MFGSDKCHFAAIVEWSGKVGCRSLRPLATRVPSLVACCRVEGLGFLLMLRFVGAVSCVLFALGANSGAAAELHFEKSFQSKSAAFMRIYGRAQPPYGFLRFCDANPEHCLPEQAGARVLQRRFDATPEKLIELDVVNRTVNRRVAPFTDEEIYGISEYWTVPTTKGDCEDYALLKREELAHRGWPRSSLLLTVVRDEAGEGHAVLTVRTQQGDFVLDNKIADVRLWSETPYEFVMRQSYVDPMVWVSLDKSYSSDDVDVSASAARHRE